MESIKISVIIPIYNAEKYIARCLHSVLENTYQNLEVLCINDGSTDKSEEVLQNFASGDSRIKVLNQPNQGVSVARNYGLDVATGDYIAFVDADDWIHKQYFECLLDACLKTGAPISVCRPIITSNNYFEDRPLNKPFALGQPFSVAECFTNYLFYKRNVWGKIIKRDIIRIRFKDGISFGEDTIFMVNLLCDNPEIKCAVLPNFLYYYYQHKGPRGSFAPSEDFLPIADAYLNCANFANLSQSLKNVVQQEAIKRLLEYRYEAWIEQKFKVAQENFRARYLNLKKDMRCFPLLQRVAYKVMATFPSLYRFIRIMKDRTLLEWEKEKPKKMDEYDRVS